MKSRKKCGRMNRVGEISSLNQPVRLFDFDLSDFVGSGIGQAKIVDPVGVLIPGKSIRSLRGGRRED